MSNGKEVRNGFKFGKAIPFWVLSLVCLGAAIYMPIETYRAFPGESFFELLPGYVLFPILQLSVGAFSAVRGWMWGTDNV